MLRCILNDKYQIFSVSKNGQNNPDETFELTGHKRNIQKPTEFRISK